MLVLARAIFFYTLKIQLLFLSKFKKIVNHNITYHRD